MIKFLKCRLASFNPAFQGLKYVVITQKNSWIHLVATVLAILLSLWLEISRTDFSIIILTIGLVWVAECINTGVETTVDLISPGKNHLAKIAKDASAAGVLLAALVSIIVGILIFLSPLISKIFHLLSS